mmetsp:Transcript_47837/g.126627  ORF Transcript_47837/g.126627 Transcript_47837/m.126627 type:complete len:95 (+) Transcript_47837:988-1272(+)
MFGQSQLLFRRKSSKPGGERSLKSRVASQHCQQCDFHNVGRSLIQRERVMPAQRGDRLEGVLRTASASILLVRWTGDGLGSMSKVLHRRCFFCS